MNPLWVVILTLGLLVAPLAAGAQQAKVPVIGVLMVSAGPKDSVVGSFRQGLRDQGYVEGRNVAIEFRSAAGRTDRLPRLAKELVDRRVDVIFPAAEPALLANACRCETRRISRLSSRPPPAGGRAASSCWWIP